MARVEISGFSYCSAGGMCDRVPAQAHEGREQSVFLSLSLFFSLAF